VNNYFLRENNSHGTKRQRHETDSERGKAMRLEEERSSMNLAFVLTCRREVQELDRERGRRMHLSVESFKAANEFNIPLRGK